MSLPIAVLTAVMVAPAPASAQVVGTPIPVGIVTELSQAVAVDPVTGMVFAGQPESGSVEAVSEATQSDVASISLGGPGYDPAALAVDPVSGTVYVTELSPPQVAVITEDPADPADDQMTGTVTVPAGTEGFDGPEGIAVLPGATPDTGTVYVSNGAGDTVSVVSEATNTVTRVIPIPAENGAGDSYPFGITVDPADGLVYVADQGDGYVSVISGSTLVGSFPLPLAGGATVLDPTAIAADPDTGTVYVTVPAPLPAGTSAVVDVIQEDPASPAGASVVAELPVPAFGDFGSPYGVPEAIAASPGAASVYVSNYEGALDVISEDTADPGADAFTDAIALQPGDQDFDEVEALAVDTSAGNPWSGTAYVVSDQTEDMYPVSFPPPLTPQSIGFTAPAIGYVGGSATLTATGGGSGNPVVFSVDPSSGAGVCSVSGTNGTTVSYLAAGACVIDANQAGNASYSAAPEVSQTITVGPASQSISFTAPATGVVGQSATLSATGGGSGNSVVFSVDSSSGAGVCSVSGDTVSYTAAGTCVIDANQAGNANYQPAPVVSQTIMVTSLMVTTTSLPDGNTDGSPYDQTLAASGGTAPYSWSVTSGTLPPGLTLSSDGVISGNPNTDGVFDFTVTVTDSESPAATAAQPLQIEVDQAPALTDSLNVSFTPGIENSYTFTTSGYPVPSLTMSGGSLPPGVTFTDNGNGTATLAGDSSESGEWSFELTITNSAGSVTLYPQITVTQAPYFFGADNTTFATGTAEDFIINVAGSPPPTISETGALPSGVSFVFVPQFPLGSYAELVGTPAAGTTGTYTITLTASNGVEPDATETFVLTVDQPPDITSYFGADFPGGTAGSFTVTATGIPAPALSISPSDVPGVTFTDNGNGTATLDENGDLPSGIYRFVITATNAVGSVTEDFALVIEAPPEIESADSTTFTIGQFGDFYIEASGLPYPQLVESGALPAGVSFIYLGGSYQLSGAPAAGSAGTYPITLTASNGDSPDAVQDFTLTVDQAPAITSASTADFPTGAAGSFTITSTGYPTAAFTESGTLPAGLTFADNGNGTATLSGTPAAGVIGNYPISVTATNAAGAVTQDLTIAVYQPIAFTSAAAATFSGGTAGLFTVTATGGPTPTITEAGLLPAGVTFTSNGNGTATLAGTPVASAGGSYAVTLTGANAVGPAVSQTFVLTVTQAPAITSASSATASAGAPFLFVVSTNGTPAPTLTRTGALPAGVTFTDDGGTAILSGVPTTAAQGVYPITFTAKNAAGTASQGFTLTVDAAPAFSSSASVTETAGTAFSYLVATTAYPTAALSAGSLPAGVTFTDNGNGTGTLAGSAAAGMYTISVSAASAVGSMSQTITLTIKAAGTSESVPAFTSPSSAAVTAGVATSVTVTTAGSPTSYTTNVTHSGGLPAGVTFTNNGNGTATLSGTPTAASGGSYPITLTAKNTAGTTTQAFVLTVSAKPAITTAASATATVGAGFSFTVAATGSPAPAMTEASALPQGLTWTDNGNGTATLSGVPAAGQGGVYTLALAATNSLGSASQTFTLTIDQIPVITSATSASATHGQAFTFTFTSTGYPSPTITHTGSVAGLTFTGGSGTATLSGTPKTAGTYTLIITAKNAIGTTSEEFTLTVS